ncbi:hypothetical protein BIW11_04486 [Tropilaelaps mercedesae]|uniref:Replication protein A 14 kDa subunit-like n=1 Tax=Tropilaelaps mercedesae TaxID=418985 RepID=A0A1V9X5I2_9ACAR|nr:hypothetical protein BIW11_04486 [Tropilaelaps mercedesae]
MRLTAKYFKDHIKKRVSIIGKVTQEDRSVCKLESACGMTVTVMFANKPDRLLNQLVEIIGTIQSQDEIFAEEHVVFPQEFCLDYGNLLCLLTRKDIQSGEKEKLCIQIYE